MFALEIDPFTRGQRTPDGEKLVSQVVASVVVEMNAVAGKLLGVSTSDNVDQEPALAKAVECRRHAGSERCRRGHASGTNGYEELETAG